MSAINILCIFGTRPEAIKMAPVVEGLKATSANVKVCITAQHRDMLDQVMEFFGLSPDFDLNLMTAGQTLNGLFARVMSGVEDVITSFKPDLVFVHGDTSTAAAAGLACFHRNIPVAHVETGLRSGKLDSPFPEELNRIVVDVFARYLFAPTISAQNALLAEGREQARITVTGNTVIDALVMARKKISEDEETRTSIDLTLPQFDKNKKMILVTGHRRESFGDGFSNICSALGHVAQRDDVHIVFPVHLNPNVSGPVQAALGDMPNVSLIKPAQYPAFIRLMELSYIVVTDSGGVQEEAPSFGKPVLVTRDVTERMEAVDAGTVKLVGTDKTKIVQNIETLLDDNEAYAKMSCAQNPYGDGKATSRIIEFLSLK